MTSVLIVGGGFAGLTAAQALLKSQRFSVTVVDRKDYFEITPAQIHQVVAPNALGDRPRFYYREVLGSHFVQGEVVSLEAQAASLADGRRLSFDTLILAPGTRYPRLPLAKPTDQVNLGQRRNAVLAEHERFRSAKAFLIIGGGLVGVELAGELAAAAPGKPVRLAHRGPRLVENLSVQASDLALTQLQALGVRVQLNTSQAQPNPDELVYDATTPEPATGFLASVHPSILDEKGQIAVDDQFRVKGHPQWYAIGDANAAADAKQAAVAGAQGEWVAQALLGSAKPYQPRPVLAFVPIGPQLGFVQLPFGAVKWKFLVNMKRKDFMVGMLRKRLGAG